MAQRVRERRATSGDGESDSQLPPSSSLVRVGDEEIDGDGDGYSACELDCDDTNPDINPDAVDIVADGLDGDCDGFETCYMDGDGDGVPAVGSLTMLSDDADCDDFGEAVASDVYDCNDAEPTIYPGATEVVVDGGLGGRIFF